MALLIRNGGFITWLNRKHIYNFIAQFPNPLASLTASDWMQRESIVKLKKLYALNVGKRVRNTYIRNIYWRSPSSLWVHCEIVIWCLITNAHSNAVLAASWFTCLELYWIFRSDPRSNALVQSQTTRISDGWDCYLCKARVRVQARN